MSPNRPSSTPYIIAASTVLLSFDKRGARVVPPDRKHWCERLLSTRIRHRVLLGSVRYALPQAIWRMIERLTLPGIMLHYQLRKNWIERLVRASLQQDFSQVVVLGAGLDTLALRLGDEPNPPRLFEFDDPATQAAKVRSIGAFGASHRIVFVHADLATDDWLSKFHRLVDPNRPTFVIAEGVLKYLPEAAVRRIVQAVAELPVPQVRFALTYMERHPDLPAGFHPRSQLLERCLAWTGQRIMWTARPDEVQAMLASHGLNLLETQTPQDLRRQAGCSVDPSELQGENVVLAERTNQ